MQDGLLKARIDANNRTAAIISILVTASGLVLLYVAGRDDWWEHRAAGRTFVETLASTLIVAGLLSALWEFVGRRHFADEVLAKAQLAADIKASGIERFTMKWNDEVPWDDLIGSAHEMDLSLSYGATWRNLHLPAIRDRCVNHKAKLRVCLPDPDDELTMNVLAKRYDATSSSIAERIREAAKEFAGLASEGADVRIYYRTGDPVFAFYRFDGRYVTTLYSHRRKRGDVPAFVSGLGSLTTFLNGEVEAIFGQGRSIAPDSLKDAEAK